MVQVTFLGTGAAFSAKRRTNVALLVQEGDTRLLVECGPTILYQLDDAGATAGQINYLFISHRHGDHILGLPMLLLVRANLLRSEGAASPNFSILASEEVMQAGNTLVDSVFPELAERLGELSWITLPADEPGCVELEPSIKLSTLPVPHSPAVSVLALRLDFEISGRSLVYSGDTTFTEEMIDFATGCDLLVHEANFSESLHPDIDVVYYGHSTSRQAGEVAARAGSRVLALVHLDPGYAGREETVRADAAQAFGGQILIPNDGACLYL